MVKIIINLLVTYTRKLALETQGAVGCKKCWRHASLPGRIQYPLTGTWEETEMTCSHPLGHIHTSSFCHTDMDREQVEVQVPRTLKIIHKI